jgi:hypothetical protein
MVPTRPITTRLHVSAVLIALSLALPALVLAAPPPNDLPPGIEVVDLPYTFTTDTTEAEIHAMEPNSTCILLGGHSVWFRFAAPREMSLVVDTFGSEYDTVIDVFEGTLIDGDDPFARLDAIACNDNAGDSPQSQLTFRARAGESYLIRVNNPLEVFGGPLTFHLRAGTIPDVAMERPSPLVSLGMMLLVAAAMAGVLRQGRRAA